jgi:hypothetical protein
MPVSRRDYRPHDRTAFPLWARLLREAFSSLVQPRAAADDLPLAVTLASEACLTGLLEDLEALGTASAVGVRRFAGPELGRVFEAGGLRDDASVRLFIVERIDLVGARERQQSAVAFLDDLTRTGVSTCVTIGRSPPARGLDPALQSRLAAGLVVYVPSRPAETLTVVRTAGSLARIIRTAARCHGLPTASLAGSGRCRGVVQARNLAMYLARHLTGSSFGTIGAAFGGRDHTTVMRGVRAVETRMTTDATFAADVEQLLADSEHSRRTSAGGRSRRRAGL